MSLAMLTLLAALLLPAAKSGALSGVCPVAAPDGSPLGNPSNDATLRQVLTQRLAELPGLAPEAIDVIVSDGIVTLLGRVEALLDKERIADTVRATTGVRTVINRVLISAGNRGDQAIERDVTQALGEPPGVAPPQIEVSVQNGVVHLAGTVPTRQQKRLSLEAVKRVPGVIDVRDAIRHEEPEAPLPEAIQAEIRGRLAADPCVKDRGIQVTVRDGQVLLSGSVASLQEKELAIGHARDAGLEQVVAADLEVRSNTAGSEFPDAQSDADLRRAILEAYAQDPRLLGGHIDVTVRHGAVALQGEVDHLRAKQAAEQDARETVGVWRVESHLKVRRSQSGSEGDG